MVICVHPRKSAAKLSEVQPELPLNQSSTWIVCSRNRDIAVSGSSLTERRRCGTDTAYRGVRVAEKKVRPIESVQERDSTFEVYSFRQRNTFEYVEIKTRR